MKAFNVIVLFAGMMVGSHSLLFSQTSLKWDMLTNVNYSVRFDENTQSVVSIPQYGDLLTASDGQVVELKGYIIPMDTEGSQYVLSAFPFSACFFCGYAGKESVVELVPASGKTRYKTDQIAIFKGKFVLSYDPYSLNYRLENAQVVRLE
ncbi:MAG: DUF3299 domain-containing protein [Bacteroidia bacterium]